MIVESFLEAPRLRPIHNTLPTRKIIAGYIDAKISRFSPKVFLRIDTPRYTIKTAQDGHDLSQVLQLRHEVFYGERQQQRALEMDMDRFDWLCDHLLIVEKETDRCVGTYRLSSSIFNNSFYSSTEFHMGAIAALPGNKLELGRACLHRDYRNTYTVALLWKGVGRYIQLTRSDYVFGCSSIATTALDEIAALHTYMKWRYPCPEQLQVTPRRKFRISGLGAYAEFIAAFQDNQSRCVSKQIPPLLKFYLKSGAMICGEPALDRAFACVDFFTLLETSRMDNRIEKKFSS